MCQSPKLCCRDKLFPHCPCLSHGLFSGHLLPPPSTTTSIFFHNHFHLLPSPLSPSSITTFTLFHHHFLLLPPPLSPSSTTSFTCFAFPCSCPLPPSTAFASLRYLVSTYCLENSIHSTLQLLTPVVPCATGVIARRFIVACKRNSHDVQCTHNNDVCQAKAQMFLTHQPTNQPIVTWHCSTVLMTGNVCWMQVQSALLCMSQTL